MVSEDEEGKYAYMSTVDLDLFKNINRMADLVVEAVLCPHMRSMVFEHSQNGGLHVTLWCNKKCDWCRNRYDDPKRWRYDQRRPERRRNVLFDYKIRRRLA